MGKFPIFPGTYHQHEVDFPAGDVGVNRRSYLPGLIHSWNLADPKSATLHTFNVGSKVGGTPVRVANKKWSL